MWVWRRCCGPRRPCWPLEIWDPGRRQLRRPAICGLWADKSIRMVGRQPTFCPQHGGGAAAEGASCSRGAQQGRLQRWSCQQWKWILDQDKHFSRRRRRPIWHADRPHGGWLGQAPRGGIASALQPWHRETQRSARGGVAQHDVLSGSATGRVCVSYVCGSAAATARAPRTTGEFVWSPFSRCFDRAWGGPLRNSAPVPLFKGGWIQ